MHSANQRSPTLVNIDDFNRLYLCERNTKTYLSSKSIIPPICRQNLRLAVNNNNISSNIWILPRTLSSLQKTFVSREKKEFKKSSGYDVYRSLARSTSQCSTNFDRETIYDDGISLGNSITIDRISPLSNTGLFRTQNLPKIFKQQQIKSNNNNSKTNENLKTISNRIEYIRRTPSQMSYRATPDNPYYDEEKNTIVTPTPKLLSCIPKNQTRKELHVYMPIINC